MLESGSPMGVLADSISTISFLFASSGGKLAVLPEVFEKLDRFVSGKKMRSVIRLKQERAN
jgi:hypothetical protein